MSATLARIERYPFKSMRGESLTTTLLTTTGIPGDRCWAIRDESGRHRGIQGARFFPGLLDCTADLLAEPGADRPAPPLRITTPEGGQFRSDDPDAGARLSDVLGTSVSLWPLQPPEDLTFYARPEAEAGADVEAELRAVFGRTPDEPLPDLSRFPGELLAYSAPPGTFFDAFPLLLLSDSALATLSAAAPGSRFDRRRFRANLLFETDADGYPEDAWVGRRLRLGGAVLEVHMRCPRCVATTHPQRHGDLPKDPKIMRSLVREHGGDLGVYARVLEPGPVALGDRVEVLD